MKTYNPIPECLVCGKETTRLKTNRGFFRKTCSKACLSKALGHINSRRPTQSSIRAMFHFNNKKELYQDDVSKRKNDIEICKQCNDKYLVLKINKGLCVQCTKKGLKK